MKWLAFLLLLLVGAGGGLAHEAASGWHYPLECCSDADCDEILGGDPLNADIVYTRKHGAVPIPEKKWKTLRPSGDGKWHVCYANQYVYCLFGVMGY